MKTLFDIGDKISVTLKGEVTAYTATKSGDCYTVELTDSKDQLLRVYLSGDHLKAATALKVEENQEEEWEVKTNNNPEATWD